MGILNEPRTRAEQPRAAFFREKEQREEAERQRKEEAHRKRWGIRPPRRRRRPNRADGGSSGSRHERNELADGLNDPDPMPG